MTESKQSKLTTKTCHRNFSQNSGYVEYNFVGLVQGPNNEKYYFCSNHCYKTFAILHCTFITYSHPKSPWKSLQRMYLVLIKKAKKIDRDP